jgi:hypothetical protein
MHRLAGCVALLCAIGMPAPAAAQFEGVVTFEYRPQDGKKAVKVLQYYKGDRLRAESKLPEAKGAYSIVDGAANRLISVTPDRASYLTVDLKPVDRLPTLKRTGKEATVAGRPCVHYALASADKPGDVADYCIAKGMGYSGFVTGRGSEGAGNLPDLQAIARQRAAVARDPAWAALMKDGAFALAMTRTLDGAVLFRGTVTGIQSKKLAANLFVPPSDYTARTLDDINRMFKAAPEKP